ncbi:uroporphyrinogen decarboxylase family protein [Raoultibacter phocaeensis]|uniref:uroporphyrinogen decarboxylase family protein n=1 Tax=Raoultibacter phocaeensis TaxID=2479841 RepID=UPI00111ADA88|nr:uroporphyrinogen decarboxylase family protein [Raoultibacter phocaeensis]
MLSPRENAMAILNREQPDYYNDFMDVVRWIPDPVRARDAIPQDGKEHKDSWGTVKVFLPGSPGAHPHFTSDNLVIPDIEAWERYLRVPEIENLDWSRAKEAAAQIDRSQHFAGLFMAAGLFERSHFLMGMEDALCNYLEYPDEMADLLSAIANFKIREIEIAAETVKPDIVFFQDDWGSKQNLFLPPAVWREIIKPLQMNIADAIHATGALYVHHADCICEPIVEDMVELGIDIWQGVIPQNDIVEIQRITEGRLPMVGGVDVPAIDVEGLPEEAIRAEVRRAIDTYCPAGRFFPGKPSGRCFIERNNAIFLDELDSYGRIWAREHPVSRG